MTASPPPRRGRWLSWIVAGAALATVVTVVAHYSDAAAIGDLLRHARVSLILVAVILQCGTYSAEAELWRAVTCRAGCRLTFSQGLQLSLAKLFIDQALPTGGVSGSVLAAAALNRRGVSPRVVAATVVVERASFFLGFAIALAIAAVVGSAMRRISPLAAATAAATAVAAAAAAIGAIWLAGRRWRLPEWLRRRGFLRNFFTSLRRADRNIVGRHGLVLLATTLQLCVIALDTLTMLMMVRALHGTVPIAGIFVSFMMSSLFRTVGILPGGLGAFEASSIVTLRLAGASIGLAASATIGFRLLSFWLPLLPGLVAARHMTQMRAGTRASRLRPHASAA